MGQNAFNAFFCSSAHNGELRDLRVRGLTEYTDRTKKTTKITDKLGMHVAKFVVRDVFRLVRHLRAP
jgi:hypothetical protein